MGDARMKCTRQIARPLGAFALFTSHLACEQGKRGGSDGCERAVGSADDETVGDDVGES